MNLRIEGDVRPLQAKLRQLGNTDLRGVNRSLAESVRTTTLQRFRDTQSPEGKKWESSIRAKKESGLTLTKSAALKNSIKTTSSISGFAVGTNNIYARTHQFGDERKIRAKSQKGLVFKFNGKWIRKKEVNITIPARPFIGINQSDLEMIHEQLQSEVFKHHV